MYVGLHVNIRYFRHILTKMELSRWFFFETLLAFHNFMDVPTKERKKGRKKRNNEGKNSKGTK